MLLLKTLYMQFLCLQYIECVKMSVYTVLTSDIFPNKDMLIQIAMRELEEKLRQINL